MAIKVDLNGPNAVANLLLFILTSFAGWYAVESHLDKQEKKQQTDNYIRMIEQLTSTVSNNTQAMQMQAAGLQTVNETLKNSSQYEVAAQLEKLNFKLRTLDHIQTNQEQMRIMLFERLDSSRFFQPFGPFKIQATPKGN